MTSSSSSSSMTSSSSSMRSSVSFTVAGTLANVFRYVGSSMISPVSIGSRSYSARISFTVIKVFTFWIASLSCCSGGLLSKPVNTNSNRSSSFSTTYLFNQDWIALKRGLNPFSFERSTFSRVDSWLKEDFWFSLPNLNPISIGST